MAKKKPDRGTIRMLVLDVDGIMTDRGIYVDDEGREFKRFDASDGAGLKMLMRAASRWPSFRAAPRRPCSTGRRTSALSTSCSVRR